MDKQRRNKIDGCYIRIVLENSRNGHAGNGGIFSFRGQGICCDTIFRMGVIVSYNDMAVIQGVRRKYNGSGKSYIFNFESGIVCRSYLLRQTDILICLENCESPVFGVNGRADGKRGVHVCRYRTGVAKRSCKNIIRLISCRSDIDHRVDDCARLELF